MLEHRWQDAASTRIAGIVACVCIFGLSPALTQELSDFTQNPNAIEAYERGVEAGMRERHEDALREFQMALEYDENFTEAYRAAGFALQTLGRTHEAIEYYEEATRRAPEFAAPWVNLAGALGLIGQPEAGLEAFSHAVDIDPQVASTQSDIQMSLLMAIRTSIPIEDSNQAYELVGFSIMPPTGDAWRVHRDQTPTYVMFEKFTGLGGEHTVFATAQIVEAPDTERSPDVFLRETLEQTLEEFRTLRRYTRLRVNSTQATQSGLSCRQSTFTVRDRGVPYAPRQTFAVSGSVFGCLHPESAVPLVLLLSTSQRHVRDRQSLDLGPELEAFLQQIRASLLGQARAQPQENTGCTLADIGVTADVPDGYTLVSSECPQVSYVKRLDENHALGFWINVNTSEFDLSESEKVDHLDDTIRLAELLIEMNYAGQRYSVERVDAEADFPPSIIELGGVCGGLVLNLPRGGVEWRRGVICFVHLPQTSPEAWTTVQSFYFDWHLRDADYVPSDDLEQIARTLFRTIRFDQPDED